MFKKSITVLLTSFALTACASDGPHVVQASPNMPELHLTGGMATEVEMPDGQRVISVVTGNPALVTAERDSNVVNLIPKDSSGETNLIVRAADDDGNAKVYQYRVVVQAR